MSRVRPEIIAPRQARPCGSFFPTPQLGMALYGFSGGGYNVHHFLNRLTQE
jgi:hypothetical protein